MGTLRGVMRHMIANLLVGTGFLLGGCVSVPSEVQATSWEPPKTTLSKPFVDATKFLLAHGLADPRGGKFEAVKVDSTYVWSGAPRVQEVHGWVFPDGHVVCWDGLSYKAISTGKPADLDRDIAEGIKNKSRPAFFESPSLVLPNNPM